MPIRFNPGDRVRRIKLPTISPHYKNMRIGDIDTVTEFTYGSMSLSIYGDGHDPKSFELYVPDVAAPKKGFGAFLDKHRL